MQRQCTLTQVQHIMLEEEWDGKIPAEFPAIEFQPTTRDNYATCITNRGEQWAFNAMGPVKKASIQKTLAGTER